MSNATAGHRVVIVGAGLGGFRVAETLRREKFSGSIVLVGDEDELPYDRPPLSKDVLVGSLTAESTRLRPRERFEQLGIELQLASGARGLDLAAREVALDDGALGFDSLVIASGAAARQLPGGEGHAHTVRTLDDAIRLKAAFDKAHEVTVVGAGFIGSEVAASARHLGLDATIVEISTAPLSRVLGPEMGHALMDLHRTHGTSLRLGVGVDLRAQHRAGTLALTDGSIIESDLVVAGIGVDPNTAWLANSGLDVTDGVHCDGTLNAGVEGVYAVGDVAHWPNALLDEHCRVEQWTNTIQQAAHVARTIVSGVPRPFVGTNYVWSDQYGKRIQLSGRTRGADVDVVQGNPADGAFLAWYRDGDRLAGALAVAVPQLGMLSNRLIAGGASWDEACAELSAASAE